MLGTGALPPGSLGENVTSEGLLESEVRIGDVLLVSLQKPLNQLCRAGE